MDHSLLPLYHIFTCVVETESISAAARQLYISQPAVSKSIKKLEDSLGVTLLIRSSKGIRLTNEGQLLYEYIHNALDSISAGEETIRHIHELGIGHLRIGVSSTLCKHILLPMLKDFLKVHPHTQVTIECQSTSHTIRLLENKEIDIGLIAQPDNNKSLRYLSMGTLQDTFAAAPQYIAGLKEREHIDQTHLLEKANLILLDKKNITRRYIDTYLTNWNISTDHAMEVGSMELLIDFAKTGLGAGCVIRQFIQKELDGGLLMEIPVPTPIQQRKVCFAYPSISALNDTTRAFINFINDTAQI